MEVDILRDGNEPGQGIAYLRDGTMVVVEQAADAVGTSVVIEVTSISQSRRGRMLFGTVSEDRRRNEDDDEESGRGAARAARQSDGA